VSRIAQLLTLLERMAGGELSVRIPISGAHDEIDAMAHAVNVLVGELDYALTGLRQAKDQAEEASRAKTLFLRNVSHEMRTPLAAILGLNELLQRAALDASRRQELHARIQSNGRHLTGLIEDLLDVSSIESGTFSFTARRLAGRESVAEVVRALESEALRRGVRVVVDAPLIFDDEAFADRKRVRQILTTLLATALKRCSGGEIRIYLLRNGNDRLCIDVADGGPARSADELRELFEPFSGAEDPLGLAVARRLARVMDGELDAAGPALRLTLAQVPRGRDPSKPQAMTAPPAPDALANMRILVAEDNDDIRDATIMLLATLGAETRTARDGLEAVELASREPFDVVLMDIRMPRLDGLAATRRLRELGFRAPIVALTADAVPEHLEECRAAGCTTHLAKPLETEQLAAVLTGLE
jgi:CheY-like chemotaxis protein/nitrogen-specific signal transduction histidine kinase